MPTQPTKGKSQLATQVSTDLLAEFREYARGREETLSLALERAMRREMKYPPPDEEVPPLPDAAPPARKKAAKNN